MNNREISGPFSSYTKRANDFSYGSGNSFYNINFDYTPDGSVQNHKHTLPENTGGSSSFNTGSSGNTESRPVDFTYKVWKRTA